LIILNFWIYSFCSCHSEEADVPLSSRRSAATRDLFSLVTASRRIPDCRFLATLGMTSGKRCPCERSEEKSFTNMPQLAAALPAADSLPLVAGWPQQTLPPPMGVTGLIKPVTMAF
ncbi:MAG: hypothetical protein RBR20_11345, partial [Desulfobacterales bacterium]|nr:hypothetical protein [Desulfobacterales bacterium]